MQISRSAGGTVEKKNENAHTWWRATVVQIEIFWLYLRCVVPYISWLSYLWLGLRLRFGLRLRLRIRLRLRFGLRLRIRLRLTFGLSLRNMGSHILSSIYRFFTRDMCISSAHRLLCNLKFGWYWRFRKKSSVPQCTTPHPAEFFSWIRPTCANMYIQIIFQDNIPSKMAIHALAAFCSVILPLPDQQFPLKLFA